MAVSIFELACRGGRHAQSNRGIVTLKPIRCNSLDAIYGFSGKFAGNAGRQPPGKAQTLKLDAPQGEKYAKSGCGRQQEAK